ncbi:response regulator transcription factor [Fodinicola feengrottensis]|uniref:Response regulator transcription factor n=2 Tax=Fodinicola feengrottensis TaxID=435914 RepID=A0ABP4UHV8_9ACTN|nr:response regulator transcription factor [Fodinicola feengrottensis]
MGRTLRVLVVEDDEDMRVAVAAELRAAGFDVTPAPDIATAAAALSAKPFVCAVFDRMLPDGDSIEYVHRYRVAGGAVPVLFLTARDRRTDVVAGFASGADDYLVKPFRVQELTARVRNLARRAGSGRSTVLRFGDIEMDTARRETRRAGVLLTLSAKEFAVLEYLMLRPEQAISRADLIEHCWDELSDPKANVVDVTVKRLRDKLHDPNVIHTVRGTGYRFGSAGQS